MKRTCECDCGCSEKVKPGNRFVNGHNQRGVKFGPCSPKTRTKISASLKGEKNPNWGKPHSSEWKAKMSALQKGRKRPEWKGNNHHNWKGGSPPYYHNKAWKLFGNNHCEMCRMPLEEQIELFGRRLHMHCINGSYESLSPDNWACICEVCHHKLDNRIGMKRMKLPIRRIVKND